MFFTVWSKFYNCWAYKTDSCDADKEDQENSSVMIDVISDIIESQLEQNLN